ncbi:MAG: hypothetical protein WKF57_01655 [Nakamurella sp.]
MDGYKIFLASEVNPRDGMLVELNSTDPVRQIAEVFEDDETGVLSFTSFITESVPLQAIEELVARALHEFPSRHLKNPDST